MSVARSSNRVLRLSRGMTYKAAVAGLHLGVVRSGHYRDAARLKNESSFVRSRLVDGWVDVILLQKMSMRVADVAHVAKETKYVTGVAVKQEVAVIHRLLPL